MSEESERLAARGRLADEIDAIRADFLANKDDWESWTIDEYLEAAAAWVRDSEGFFANSGRTPPTIDAYEFVGMVLSAASRYE